MFPFCCNTQALRQKQIAVLKTAMDEAQEKAQEEKNVRRMQHLQQGGHDVSQLKATYEGKWVFNHRESKTFTGFTLAGLEVIAIILESCMRLTSLV